MNADSVLSVVKCHLPSSIQMSVLKPATPSQQTLEEEQMEKLIEATSKVVCYDNPAFESEENDLIKFTYGLNRKNLEYIQCGFQGLLEEFWPQGKASRWEDILNKILYFVDEADAEKIKVITFELIEVRERMENLVRSIEDQRETMERRDIFLNIGGYLVDYKHNFKFNSEHTKRYVLPLYSVYLLLTVSFYTLGIRNPAIITLFKSDLEKIKHFLDASISTANGYISAVNDEWVESNWKLYDKCDVYNNIMIGRTYIAIHGFEFLEICKHLMKDSEAIGANICSNVISYSTYHGEETPSLIAQALSLSEPLTPEIINGKRNKIQSVDICYWSSDDGLERKIGGMTLYFENGNNCGLGIGSDDIEWVEFEAARLEKLVAYGDGVVDGLEFYFSDGRIECFGINEGESSTQFYLPDHHIVSIYMSSMGEQALNISVSYQRTYLEK